MPEKDFKPPKYKEELHVLFDKQTGEIIATEQRWTLVQKASPTETTGISPLFKSIASGLNRNENEFDVLVLPSAKASKAQIRQVDVHRRKPVFEKQTNKPRQEASPYRLETP